MRRRWIPWLFALAAGAAGSAAATGCDQGEPTRLDGQVRLTLLHTADIHSRLFPYNLQIGHIDAQLGLGATDSITNVGGAARISHILGRERARAARSLHVDGGDCFQGAPVFNFFDGEAEIRSLVAMGTDAMVVANHEFDKGALNLGIQLQRNASYPVLAANYSFEDPSQPGASPLGSIVVPFETFDVDGLRVTVIGMGNLSSITSIFDQPNRLGIQPLKTSEVAQFYIDLVRPFTDVIVVATHLGLEYDERMIEATTGIDVVLGGHNHIVLQPPKRVADCAAIDQNGNHYIETAAPGGQDPDEPSVMQRRYCTPREVVLAHSGAFAKFAGRLDLVLSNHAEDLDDPAAYDPLNRFEVASYDYRLFPINDSVPEDPIVTSLLEPYAFGLDALANLDLLVGFAPDGSRRFSTSGGDSPLGNLIATAMWLRLGIQTDFSLTNTTGIRADLVPGAVDVEQMYNIFPFDNSITKMQLSGKEVQELFNFVARRSSGRGCKSQAQIAGARVVIDCTAQPDPNVAPGIATHVYIGTTPQPCASDLDCPGAELGSCDSSIGRCWLPIDTIASYELATSNYLAAGGSGFRVLQRNTTQLDTKVQQRDALMDFIRAGSPCGADPATDEAFPCSTDADCAGVGIAGETYVCACAERAWEQEGALCGFDPVVACASSGGSPELGEGACVLQTCVDAVANYERAVCARSPTEDSRQACLASLRPCAAGGETCKFLACIDGSLGNNADGRLRMLGQ